MLPRPRFRIPLWVALAVPAAAYVIRSMARGFDFVPDLPIDAVVLAALLVVVGLVAWLRADESRRAEDRPAAIEPTRSRGEDGPDSSTD